MTSYSSLLIICIHLIFFINFLYIRQLCPIYIHACPLGFLQRVHHLDANGDNYHRTTINDNVNGIKLASLSSIVFSKFQIPLSYTQLYIKILHSLFKRTHQIKVVLSFMFAICYCLKHYFFLQSCQLIRRINKPPPVGLENNLQSNDRNQS